MSENIKIKDLVNELNRRSARAVLGQSGFQSTSANNYLRSKFEQAPGTEGSFFADPLFEATFGWKESQVEIKDLKDNLLSDEVLEALSNPPPKDKNEDDYAFPLNRRPYQHQLEAWETLLSNPIKSALISSGTGSGKTECFLIPILEDLYREYKETSSQLTGVRALFLYPLNALINSQRDRLSAWTYNFHGDIRFCLYNGETPSKRTKSEKQQESPSEVKDRTTLRENPSPILVTNSTMLEYMLVRKDDAQIIEKSQGCLRWIVLDEAHTYIGSQAAELSLLLRRVVNAFGVKAEDVRFVATSATIGGLNSQKDLQKFLANVAGVHESQVHVIQGERHIPTIPQHTSEFSSSFNELLDINASNRFETMCKHPATLAIRNKLSVPPYVATTWEIAHDLSEIYPDISKEKIWKLFDSMSSAKDNDSSFLPIRTHLFQKTLNNIYACTNSNCTEMDDLLKDGDWHYGAIYLSEKDFCKCGGAVQPIVSCGSCGQEYLEGMDSSKNGRDSLLYPTRHNDEDEFIWDIEPQEENVKDNDNHKSVNDHILLSWKDGDNLSPIKLNKNSRELVESNYDIRLYAQPSDQAKCVTCGTKSSDSWNNFRPKRLGAPFFLGDSLPTLLGHSPKHGDGPFDSRRLLTFTDSRQGTARIAARLQQDIDRNKVRSILYHEVNKVENSGASIDEIKQLKEQIKSLETYPELASILEEKVKELKDKESPPSNVVRWNEASTALSNSKDVKSYMLNSFKELSGENISSNQFADFNLYREFMRRPIRGFQLETLGMVEMFYPQIEDIEKCPDIWKDRYMNDSSDPLQDWKDWLTTLIDIHIRANSAVEFPEKWQKLMGAKVSRKYIVAPDDSRDKFVLRWPSVYRSTRSKSVNLLSNSFKLDTQNPEHKDIIEDILKKSWDAIKKHALKIVDENRYLLDLKDKAAFRKVNRAWKCPYSKRLVTRVFKELSPNTPGIDPIPSKCIEVQLPDMPYSHDTFGEGRLKIIDWLNSNEQIVNARDMGVWPNRADRIAAGEPWFRIAEHSAQVDSKKLESYEKLFKEGKLNVLSCSTTMEMGVDIGGMSVVAMTNVPPHPANYLQRAGRAGRRKESSSVCYTLCKPSAHSMQVFNNPKWPFTTTIDVPKVSLESSSIVQRHINALILAYWLRTFNEDIPKLTTGWFFEKTLESHSIVDDFVVWCDSIMPCKEHSKLIESIKTLSNETICSSVDTIQLIKTSKDMIEDIHKKWLDEFSAIKADLDKIIASSTTYEKEPSYKAINLSLKRMSDEYLLRDLANSGFLPGYGFPTNVVSLTTTTLRELDKEINKNKSNREDSFGRKNGGPSRDLAVALREYAPGAEVVMEGLVYRSAGITLNWKQPANANAAREIQNIYYQWDCNSCGEFGDKRKHVSSCPQCGSHSININEVLEPAGFSVDLFERPHTDVNKPIFMPYEDPKVAAVNSPWLSLPNASLGRVRYSDKGIVSHVSKGMHQHGYTLCLSCGRAEPQSEKGHPVSIVAEEHRKLRGGKNGENGSYCDGPNNDYMIKQDLHFVSKTLTSVFEIELRDPQNEYLPVKEPIIAWTLGYALRNSLTSKLGIDQREVEVSIRDSKLEDGKRGFILCLFDTATQGAGYVEKLQSDLPELIEAAIHNMECPRDCETACQYCLLDNSTQYKEEYLNRKKAHLWVSEWFKSFKIASNMTYFGDNSTVKLFNIRHQLEASLKQNKYKKIQFFVEFKERDAASISEWEIFNLSKKLMDGNELEVEWVLIGNNIENWRDKCGRQLSAMLNLYKGQFHIIHSPDPNYSFDGKIIMSALIENHGKYWAAESPRLDFSTEWGSSKEPIISTIEDVPVIEINSKTITDSDLVFSLEPSSLSMRIDSEFDGKISGFGNRFIALIDASFESLGKKLKGSVALKSIHYSDRYLCSPLYLTLLYQLVNQIFECSGERDTLIKISTNALDDMSARTPYKLFHNISSDNERNELLKCLMSSISDNFELDVKDNARDLKHSRTLTLEFRDSTCFEIDFDQGMGSWDILDKSQWYDDEDLESKTELIISNTANIGISKLGTTINIRQTQ